MKRQAFSFKPSFLLAFAALLLTALPAQAQPAPSDMQQLTQAEKAYQSDNYDQALTLTETTLKDEDELSTSSRMRAYLLKGLTHTRQGNMDAAREATQELVYIYPTYEPGPDAPQEFVQLVDEAKTLRAEGNLPQQQPQEGTSLSSYIYGSIAIGLSAAIVAYGMSDLFGQ